VRACCFFIGGAGLKKIEMSQVLLLLVRTTQSLARTLAATDAFHDDH